MGLGRAFNTLVVGARVGMSCCSWRESFGLGVDSCWRELLGVLSEGVAVGGSCLVSCRRELLSEGFVCITSRPLIFITCGWVGEASFGSRGARAGFECQRLYFCNGFFCCNGFFGATATFGDGNGFSALDDRFAVFAFLIFRHLDSEGCA